MGKLYKRGDTYYADYCDRDGIRRRESTRTGDKEVARERLRGLELRTTDRAPHETEALADAIDYFVNVACAGKPAGTIRCYRQKGRHLARLIGGTPLDKLSREIVERYIAARLEEGSHRHSVHKELVVLRGTIKSARARDRFHGSMEVIPEFESGYVPRTTYLTADQFLALVPHLAPPAPANSKQATLDKRDRRAQQRALYCLLIAFASPRKGELEALTWEHVDFDRGMIRVPKGKTISRVIAIHPQLRPWLEGFGEMAGWTGPVTEPWTNVGRDLPAACKRAGVPVCTPNDLRRTFASWMIQAGVSNRIVARLLGHSTTRMVDLVYGQIDDATLSAAIMRLPGCDAGVSNRLPQSGTTGTTGHSPSTLTIVNSVEESTVSSGYVVPKDGVEPPTRGFSVLSEMAPKPVRRQRKLRAV
jgi:integrase